MRLLFVVQRYGVEVGGGAEQHCRWLAEGLQKRGHDVTIATSQAIDYMTWTNHYVEELETLNGVSVRRFPVDRPRDVEFFNRLSHSVDFHGGTHPDEIEDVWLAAQGPSVVGMTEWLETNCETFDVVIPFTYLYRTSQITIDTCKGRVPIVMHATAHDEPPFYLRRIRNYLSLVDGFLCSTPEEASLLERTLPICPRTEVVGVGVSLESPGSLRLTMNKYGIPLKPYCLILGRVDESKGVFEGIDFFRRYQEMHRSALRLIVAGQNVAGLGSDELVTIPGFVNPDELSALVYGAEFLIQPSYFESFSLALCESWLAGTPTLANGNCEPVAGQTRRSGGGLLYENCNQFAKQADRLHRQPSLRRQLSISGKNFVRDNFESEVVLRRIEALLTTMSSRV